ncbi:alginate lyase family protein [Bacteroidota bacterium]
MLNSFATFIRTFRISPEIAFRKVYEAIISKLTAKKKRLKDFENTTFSEKPDWLGSVQYSYYHIPSIENLNKYKDTILNVAELFLEHKFNLLGSGWVKVYHGAEVSGLEGYHYTSETKLTNWADWLKSHVSDNNYGECVRILNNINQDYKPIDWQLDFKFGYRWSETCWYKDLKYGDIPGADIKVPWELGRMQHLILLAYAYSLSKSEESNSNPDKYSDEFQNQVLDFIASNPPRYGVQWMTSMDVGIRAVNWLVAYDLFRSAGVEFGEEFESIFAGSIYEHGIHILNNLEWSSGLRGNHYLSNVVSLLYIAAYLPVSEKTNLWLAFALQEFIYETYFQFLPDGGNFEASLSYHAFASEMVMHSVALILALPEDKVSGLLSYNEEQWGIKKRLHTFKQQDYQIVNNQLFKFSDNFLHHLMKIAEFSYSIAQENGKSAQIGDNDSGRFLKFTPDYSFFSKQDTASLFSNLKDYLSSSEEKHYYHENFNNQLIPIAVISSLIKSKKLLNHRTKLLLEHDIIRKMLRVRTNDEVVDENMVVGGLSKLAYYDSNIGDENIIQVAFPNFGIYINRSSNYTSFIRCGQIGQLGKGGHAHNDQLSFNLCVKGRDFIIDPGTYLYTALKKKRNFYRSTRMHNTLYIEGYEQNKWREETKDDLFWLCKDRAKAKTLQFSNSIFIGEHHGFRKPHKRIITFDVNSINCVDICEINKEKNILFHLAPDVEIDESVTNGILLTLDDIVVELTTEKRDKSLTDIKVQDYFYSPSYGIIQKSKKIILISSDNKINWKISITTN